VQVQVVFVCSQLSESALLGTSIKCEQGLDKESPIKMGGGLKIKRTSHVSSLLHKVGGGVLF